MGLVEVLELSRVLSCVRVCLVCCWVVVGFVWVFVVSVRLLRVCCKLVVVLMNGMICLVLVIGCMMCIRVEVVVVMLIINGMKNKVLVSFSFWVIFRWLI